MVWNSPDDDKESGNSKPRDPWTDQPRRPEEGPPHLTDLLVKLKERLTNSVSRKGPSKDSLKFEHWLGIASVVVAGAWIWASMVNVDQNQEAIVTRFGVYQQTLPPGLYWRPWGIDRVQLFDRRQIHSIAVSSEILTEDFDLAQITATINYQISSPKQYLFASSDPQLLLSNSIQAGLQAAAASNTLDAWLSNNNPNLQKSLTEQLNAHLAEVPIGVSLTEVKITDVAVPQALKETFAQITALYNAQDTEKEKAVIYEKEVLPPAQAKADQIVSAAKAEAAKAISEAKADEADFAAWLPAYLKAPEVTRYRLYTKTMEEVLSKSTNVITNSKESNVSLALQTASTLASPVTTNTPATVVSADADSDDNSYGNVKGGYG